MMIVCVAIALGLAALVGSTGLASAVLLGAVVCMAMMGAIVWLMTRAMPHRHTTLDHVVRPLLPWSPVA